MTPQVSIYEHMSGLAREHDAVNLGQGFPDFGWPEDVVDRAAQALRSESNQYPPMRGLPALREAVAAHYHAHQGLAVQPGQVIVTSGATEALAASLGALVQPGDEVLLFQPLYDAYLPGVLRAGGIPRFVSLEPPGWRIDEALIARAFTPRTRLAIFNNPHNPTARMFDKGELGLLADACLANDVRVIADEVWEHIIFDDRAFTSLASLPGMADRVVKIGSAGKIFSLTGWKVGWAVAPSDLAEAIAGAHQYLTFATAPNLQTAAAYGLAKEQGYFDAMRSGFAQARDTLVAGLEANGLAALPAEGTYFVAVDLAASEINTDDRTFCERAVREAGIAAIPFSACYEEAPLSSVIRLCFAKKSATIEAAIDRLGAARAMFAR